MKLKRKLKRALKGIALEKDPERLAELEREKLEIVDRINYIKVSLMIRPLIVCF